MVCGLKKSQSNFLYMYFKNSIFPFFIFINLKILTKIFKINTKNSLLNLKKLMLENVFKIENLLKRFLTRLVLRKLKMIWLINNSGAVVIHGHYDRID
ncbi:hypothetical protein BKP29_0217735 [Bacillus licheniformis]|nr:hypothetical protein BSZ43_09755 [Bacillus sp. H15-1]ASV15445.1 hypothetical protein CJO35_09840 [Bacillus sp. 1s-1]OKS82334.1 hypothetical protein BFN05_10175 [Bacillus licheniformis]OLO18095.1 hypothetical protein BKP29_0217735 [Bacillus licheniformis]PAC91356.1 hypothetical protein CHH99_16485 [Bacillus licheniformis]